MPFALYFKMLFNNPAIVCSIIALTSLLSIGGALLSQYGFGMEPCILCIYQRWPHAIAILLGFAGLYLASRKTTRSSKQAALIIIISAPVFLIGAAIAFYHVGVEQHWWASALEACAADFSTLGNNLLQQIETKPAVRCDVIPFELFGISMAGYNALLSVIMAVYCLIAAIMVTRRANGF